MWMPLEALCGMRRETEEEAEPAEAHAKIPEMAFDLRF